MIVCEFSEWRLRIRAYLAELIGVALGEGTHNEICTLESENAQCTFLRAANQEIALTTGLASPNSGRVTAQLEVIHMPGKSAYRHLGTRPHFSGNSTYQELQA